MRDEVSRTELLYLTLLRIDRYTVLPAIHAVFGEEAFLRFMEMFAGSTLEVPPAAKLERAVRDVTIFLRLKKASNKPEATKRLSAEYDITEQTVCNIASAMDDVVAATRDWKKLDSVFLESPRDL